jgi:uncharacterized protein (DUF736 family)
MAQIGTFTRGDDGILSGTIRTLSLNVKARFVPAEASSNEKAPALRVCSPARSKSAPPGSGRPRTTPSITR